MARLWFVFGVNWLFAAPMVFWFSSSVWTIAGHPEHKRGAGEVALMLFVAAAVLVVLPIVWNAGRATTKRLIEALTVSEPLAFVGIPILYFAPAALAESYVLARVIYAPVWPIKRWLYLSSQGAFNIAQLLVILGFWWIVISAVIYWILRVRHQARLQAERPLKT